MDRVFQMLTLEIYVQTIITIMATDISTHDIKDLNSHFR